MPIALETEIEIVEPMGADTVAWGKIGGQQVSLRTSADVTIKPGDRVLMGFDPARGSVFDAASGQRL